MASPRPNPLKLMPNFLKLLISNRESLGCRQTFSFDFTILLFTGGGIPSSCYLSELGALGFPNAIPPSPPPGQYSPCPSSYLPLPVLRRPDFPLPALTSSPNVSKTLLFPRRARARSDITNPFKSQLQSWPSLLRSLQPFTLCCWPLLSCARLQVSNSFDFAYICDFPPGWLSERRESPAVRA